MTPMNFSHWSGKVISTSTLDLKKQMLRPSNKPLGLWISVDGPDDWKEWCESTGYDKFVYKTRHVVRLKPTANILFLSSAQQIDEFTDKFSIVSDFNSLIDWAQVSSLFQGIVIAPYCWIHMRTFWYYTWDCASGCIWDVSAIESVIAVKDSTGECEGSE